MVTTAVRPSRTVTNVRRPQAHPARPRSAGRVRGGVASCVVAPRPVVQRASGAWLKCKLAAVAVLALAGTGVAVNGFVEQFQVDPQVDVVAGDPGWAHVTGR